MEPPLFLPAPKIKEEDDTCNVIDLDKDQTPEDVVYEWDLRVRIKFKNCSELCEQSLDALMKWYIQSVKEEALNFEDFTTLKIALAKHLQFFKLYFMELNCCCVDNYLDNVEEILTFYSNIEVKSLPRKRRDGNRRAHKKLISSVCRKLISMLYIYLMNREDRICHVIMKVKLDLHSEECKELLNLVYGNFCTKEPRDKTDLEFCRAYILCQKWKTIREPHDWEKMDEVMYSLYCRTPESLKTNETLRQILYPQNTFVLDVLIHYSEKHIIMTDAYFKFIKSKKSEEDNVIAEEINNIALHDEIVPDLVCDDDDHEEFNRAYNNFVRTMSAISQVTSECVKLEDESDDDELQIIAISPLGHDSTNSDLIHEFVDDDIEIIYFKKRDDPSLPLLQNALPNDVGPQSLWGSQHVPNNKGSRMEKVTSSTNNRSVLFKPTTADSRVSTSTSISTQSVERRKCKTFTQIPSMETETSNNISENTQVSVSTNSSIRGVLTTDTENKFPTDDTRNTTDMETSTDEVRPPSPIKIIKSVSSIETQTEDFSQVVSDNDLNTCQCSEKVTDKCQQAILENHAEQDGICGSYYYYGLVTPPSDQPPDEHNIPPTESSLYPNVYANIVRTHSSQDETDSIVKGSENDYLPSLGDENDSEEINGIMPVISKVNGNADLVSVSPVPESPGEQNNVEDQSTAESDEDSITDNDVEFRGEADRNTEKIHNNLDNCSGQSGHCEPLPAKSVITQTQIDHFSRNKDALKKPNLNGVCYEHKSSVNGERILVQEPIKLISNAPLSCTNIDISSVPTSRNQKDFDNAVTSGCHNNHIDSKTDSSLNIQCTSTDFNLSSAGCLSPSGNIPPPQVEIKLTNLPCTSPDITSTSVDIHSFHENVSNQGDENSVYVNGNESDVINPYINNENYCLEYIEYSEGQEITEEFVNNEDVSQSNLAYAEGEEEIFIEESVLMNNEQLFIIGEELSIATNVNIRTENDSDELSATNVYSPSNENCPEIEEHETVIETNEHHEETDILPLTAVEEGEIPNYQNEGNADVSGITEQIMFTSSEKVEKPPVDAFEIFQDNLHGKWSDLHDSTSLDNILSGPVTKVNGSDGCVNPDTSFDLFSSKPYTACKEDTPKTSVNSSSSSVEVTSPEYEEGIDDFKTYYEQSKNSTALNTSLTQNNVTVSVEKSSASMKNHILYPLKEHNTGLAVHSSPKGYICLGDTPINTTKPLSNIVPVTSNDQEKPFEVKNRVKRINFAFAENIYEECRAIPHSTTENTNILQGILKKPPADIESPRNTSKPSPRIPQHSMNLKSLAQFNVKPNDPCLQGVPCVVIERLSDREISQWLRVSEISRKVRMQKKQAQYVATQPVYKLDYDKTSPIVCSGDRVSYSTSRGRSIASLPQTLRNWRFNPTLPSKSSRMDEGMVAPTFNSNLNNDNDYNNCTPTQCKNSCCDSLAVDLTNLNVSRIPSDSILNLSCCNPSINLKCSENRNPPKCNPFLSKTDINQDKPSQELVNFVKIKHNYCDIANLVASDSLHQDNKDLDLNLVANISNKVNFRHNLISNSNLGSNKIDYKNVSTLTNQPAVMPKVEHFSNFENNDTNKLKLEGGNGLKLKWGSLEDTKIGSETRLPLKKRKHSVANPTEEVADDVIGPELVEEIIKRARAENIDKEDISYPAKPMLSIAEIQEKLSEPHPRTFKTAAERKEMPPTPQYLNSSESPRIITEQYNNHTYNNPTINYHMNNVPYQFFPCASLSYFPPFLLPMNSTTAFDVNLVTHQRQSPSSQEPVVRTRKEKKTRGRKRHV